MNDVRANLPPVVVSHMTSRGYSVCFRQKGGWRGADSIVSRGWNITIMHKIVEIHLVFVKMPKYRELATQILSLSRAQSV